MESDYLKLDDGFVIRRIRPHEKLKGETIFGLQGQNYFLEFVSDLGLDEEIAEFPMPFEDQRLQFFLEVLFLFKEGTFSYNGIYSIIGVNLYGGGTDRQYLL